MKRILCILLSLLLFTAAAGSAEGWPSGRFPNVPEMTGVTAMTELTENTAVVSLAKGDDAGYDAYGSLLIENGFDLYVSTGVASVYSDGNTDIVLMRDPEGPFIRILNEPDCGWGTDEYLPPLFGRFVSAEEKDGAVTVTVRSAAPDLVIDYFAALTAAGWDQEVLFTGGDCTAYGVYTKKNRRITADYYALGFDFTVTLDETDR